MVQQTFSREEILNLVRLGSRVQNRKKKVTSVIGAIVAFAILRAGDGWLVMLLFGMLHSEFSRSVPAIGYWTATFVWVIVLSLVTTMRTQGIKRS